MGLAEVAAVVGGHAHGDPDVVVSAAASVDSRTVPRGGLFVAIDGEHVDGHDFVAAAVGGGAAAVLCSRPVDAPCIVVDDATAALGLLARHVLDHIDATVVAITGSQGKTSVKDLVAHLLEHDVVATLGNNNNELGVPLTVLRAEETTQYLVVEMGARGVGHVAALCRIAPPDVAVVLNVGSAHVGEFGSIENIALAKGELVESLGAGGTAVLNGADRRVLSMVDRLHEDAAVTFFGNGPSTSPRDVVIVDVGLDAAGEADVTLAWGDGILTAHLPLVGSHHAVNLAAAVATVGAVVSDERRQEILADAAGRLGEFRSPSPMRMERHRRPDGVVIVDDSYNANPESMTAALHAVRDMRAGRRVAVLGEMLELGDDGDDQHVRIGRLAAELDYDLVVAVGEGSRGIATGAGGVGVAVPDVTVALDTLRAWLVTGDVVLVKASRGARLERVTRGLLTD
ncbi:UDP-N-acetylmuramoyl-tripeptide--D-alanyl-D-alanine ligase [Aeromicrobium sp. CF4.19]|uniref:UDP-N-acetylmuramoyl-tripeptide--D-alanyl-D- alanine ligase n=1 Tax=Aeromicrobium sp. CF4.19 TaxID=3373082 RepID=UPI003EE45B76